MKTRTSLALLAAVGLALAAAPRAVAQDQITLKSEPTKPVKGTIASESPAGIKLKGKKALIPAADVMDVLYDISGGLKLEFYRPALNAEKAIDTAANRKKALAAAIKAYQEFLPKLSAKSHDMLRRHVEYKIAALTAQQAQEEGLPLDGAIKLLTTFKNTNADGWQITRVGDMLAQMLLDTKRPAEAEQVYTDLAALKLPEEDQARYQLQAARVSMLAGKHAVARSKLAALARKLGDSRAGKQAMVYQAECLAAADKIPEARDMLVKLLADAKTDKELRAQIYNTLGYCEYLAKQYKEALWDFLRVDVVYSQDRDEHARALYYLADLFDKLKEAPRATEAKEKLKSKEYAGTEYQRRLLKDEAAKGK